MIKALQIKLLMWKARFPEALKSKYILLLLVFFGWMLFFDKHSFYTQFQLYMTEYTLEKDKVNYAGMITEAKSERQNLERYKEKFAREKYFIQKKNEDVFIIVREQKQ